MSEMVSVRLLKAYGKNNEGELCGFPSAIANALLEKGFATTMIDARDALEETEPPRVDKMEHGAQRRPRRSAKAESNGN